MSKESEAGASPRSAGVAPPTGGVLARNTLLNIAGQLTPLLIGLLTIPPVIRGLGVDRFGVLTLCWVLLGYLGVFQLGIGPAVTKHTAELLGKGERAAASSLRTVSVRLSALLGALAGAVLASLTPYLTKTVFHVPIELSAETRAAFYLLALTMPFLFVSGALRGFLSAAQRFGVINAVWLVTTSLNYLVPLFAVLLGRGLATILIAIAISRVAATWVLLRFSSRLDGPAERSGGAGRIPVRGLLRFGGWVAISSAMNPLLSHLERFLIASFLSVGLLTYYATPFEMISRVAVLPASLALTLFPAISYHGRENREAVLPLVERSLKWLFFLMAPVTIVLVAFGDSILALWLGGDFGERSASLFRVLAFSFFFHAFAYVPLSVVQGFGRPDLKAKLDLIEVPLFALFLVLLLPRGGLNGAAAAKLLITLVDVAALLWLSHRLLRFKAASLLGWRPVLVFVATLAYALGVWALPSTPGRTPWAIAGTAVLTALYVVFFARVGMDRKDREVWRSLRSRIGGGKGNG